MPWVNALHIIFMVTRFAGPFYLPRLSPILFLVVILVVLKPF